MIIERIARLFTQRAGWPAAETDRTNSAMWSGATGEEMNLLLGANLETIRKRAELEIMRNAIVAGVIETHITDVVGTGPTLQVQSASKAYNEKLEGFWAGFWECPDINGVLSGPETLQNDVYSLWPGGEFIEQITSDPAATTPIKTRLLLIHPRHLATPLRSTGDASIVMGIKISPSGKPLTYYFTSLDQTNPYALGEETPVPAEYVIHGFAQKEPGQVRGIPYLASSLQEMADLREFRLVTLDAARAAADSGLVYYTEADGIDPVVAEEITEMERRTQMFLPPHYKAMQIKPEHPPTGFIEFIENALLAVGRPVCMPLMIILCNSNDHNYSSARFDDGQYRRAVLRHQRWLEWRKLNRLVWLVAREAMLTGNLGERPAKVRLNWLWPKAPHVDPKKEQDAQEGRLGTGQDSYADTCAHDSRDWEGQLDQLATEVQAFKAKSEKIGIELIHPFIAANKNAAAPKVPTPEEAAEEAAEEAENDVGGRMAELARERRLIQINGHGRR